MDCGGSGAFLRSFVRAGSSFDRRETLKRVLLIGAAALVAGAPALAAEPEADGVATLQQSAPPPDAAPPSRELDPARLLKFAREKRTSEGCAAAAPAYRVVAGMGEGQEAAQEELGECLLDIKTENETERMLFRQEGAFWLARAAYAGNARAQRRLAIETAAPASSLHDPKASLKWALVYGKNPDAKLYGFGPLPPTMEPGLRAALDEASIAEAEKFAAGFAPLHLQKFEPPARGEKRAGAERPKAPPPGGRRRGPGVSG